MLNLNGSLAKGGVTFATLWSEDFNDAFFVWAAPMDSEGTIDHDMSHVKALDLASCRRRRENLGVSLAKELKAKKAILGVFDEGCMGMYQCHHRR